MKKSGMAERMRKHFNTEHCDQVALLAYQIIDFLEQQGMLPPAHETFVEIDYKLSPTGERVYCKRQVNEWEDEE